MRACVFVKVVCVSGCVYVCVVMVVRGGGEVGLVVVLG